MNQFAKLDHGHVWHPFTQMKDWLRREPIVIASGKGAMLRDVQGKEYLDANSSIWTNLHGHAHPKINAALQRQLKKIAHSSALGLANEPASVLAARLVELANQRTSNIRKCTAPHWAHLGTTTSKHPNNVLPCVSPAVGPGGNSTPASGTHGSTLEAVPRYAAPHLGKVFFSDDGSTAMEVALKLAYEFARRTGRSQKPKFLSLAGAYHGDTVGAVSLGHIDLFHKNYSGLLFKADQVPAPYCYRCPFNRAKPERADAREYRKCHWECVTLVERKFSAQRKRGNPYAAMVVEPLIQGAAGMVPQPAGWLRRVAEIIRSDGAQLIADEVMTGFGRTGSFPSALRTPPSAFLFASQHEGVQPDYLALAKGLTGGYLPMAATLTTQAVFDAFLGDYEEFKTFFHGHSYTANQLGAAAALASLELLQTPASIRARATLEQTLREELKSLWSVPNVGDIRQVGLIVGVELVRDWRTREPFDLRERAGIRVGEAMAKRGVLTRPIGNVIVIMPPYCTTPWQARRMISTLRLAVRDVLQ